MNRYMGWGLEGCWAFRSFCPCGGGVHHPPGTWMCLPAWKLSELCTSRLFVEASSRRYDRLGTHFAVHFPYPALVQQACCLHAQGSIIPVVLLQNDRGRLVLFLSSLHTSPPPHTQTYAVYASMCSHRPGLSTWNPPLRQWSSSAFFFTPLEHRSMTTEILTVLEISSLHLIVL